MASAPQGPFVLEVTFERREDGGLRAYCDRVPGFVLSHARADLVMADVEPALSTILSAMYGMQVEVRKAEEIGVEHEVSLPAHLCGAMQYVGLSQHA